MDKDDYDRISRQLQGIASFLEERILEVKADISDLDARVKAVERRLRN